MCGEETVKATDLIPAKSNRNFQVMIWGYICWHGVGALSKVTGIINSKKYRDILEDNIQYRHHVINSNDELFREIQKITMDGHSHQLCSESVFCLYTAVYCQLSD